MAVLCHWVLSPSGRLKNLKDINKWSSLSLYLPGNVSYLRGWAVPVQSDGFNSALSPVVYGDIALSINTQYNTKIKVKVNLLYTFCFSDDDTGVNPMVAGFVEDIESEDESASFSKPAVVQHEVDLSSDEEDGSNKPSVLSKSVISTQKTSSVLPETHKSDTLKYPDNALSQNGSSKNRNTVKSCDTQTNKNSPSNKVSDSSSNERVETLSSVKSLTNSSSLSSSSKTKLTSERSNSEIREVDNSTTMTASGPGVSDSDSDSIGGHQVAVLQDVEDVSEDETVASSKQADSGVMLDSNLVCVLVV